MRKLWDILVLTLAVNFLALAGGAGYLYRTGHLDRAKVMAVKELIFPPPTVPLATTQPTTEPTTQPAVKLDELLAKQSGRTATEQVDFIQHTFDAQMAQLDRRQREVADLERQVEMAKQQAAHDRAALLQDRNDLAARAQEANRLLTDKGFQDSLALYSAMPARQAKTIFMTLDEKTMLQYFQAMEPRAASKIMKEFKAPEEVDRIQRVLEKMRQSPPAATDGAPQANQPASGPPVTSPQAAAK